MSPHSTNRNREAVRTRRSALLLLAPLLALAACDDLLTDGEGVETTGDWTLGADPTTALEPGQTILISIDGDIPEDAVIHVDAGTDREYAVPLFQPLRGPSDAGVLQIPVPVLTPGRHTLHLGTLDRLESNAVEVRVIEPPRRRSPAEVATLLEAGLTAYGDALHSLLTTAETENTRRFLDAALGEYGDAIDDWSAVLAAIAEVTGEVYREIPEEDERRFQAALHHAGVLDRLERMAAGTTAPATGVLDHETLPLPVLRFFPHDAHAHLFLMDMLVAAGHAEETILSILTLVAGGEANQATSKAGMAASVWLRFARAIFQAIAPTDIVAIEAHHQAMVYEHQRIRELWWSHQRPQERWSEAIIEFSTDAAATALSASWSHLTRNRETPGVDFWERLISDLLIRISTKVGSSIVRAPIPQSGYAAEAKVPMNPGAYHMLTSPAIAELAPALPILLGPPGVVLAPAVASLGASLWLNNVLTERFGGPAALAKRMAGSFEGGVVQGDDSQIVWGLSASGDDALGAEAAEGFDVDYHHDEIFFPALSFTESGPRTAVADVELRAFHFESRGLRFLGDVPWPVVADVVSHPIQINAWPGPNAERRDKPLVGQAMIINRWLDPSRSTFQWVVKGHATSNRDRFYRFYIGDAHGSCQAVDRKARARVVFENARTSAGRTELPMQELEESGPAKEAFLGAYARPGLSRVIVEAEPADCGFRTDWGYRMWIEFGFLDAINQRPVYDIRANEPVTSTINVWTPPCFEPCGGR